MLAQFSETVTRMPMVASVTHPPAERPRYRLRETVRETRWKQFASVQPTAPVLLGPTKVERRIVERKAVAVVDPVDELKKCHWCHSDVELDTAGRIFEIQLSDHFAVA